MSASVVISTPLRHAGHPHGLADELVLEVLDARDDLLLGVVDVDLVVEALLHDDVDVLVDRAVEDPAAVLPVVARQVGPAAEQADAQGRLGDDHRKPVRATPLGLAGTRRRCRCRGSIRRPALPWRGPPAAAAGDSRCRCGGVPSISSSTLGWNAYIPAFTRSETGSLGFSVKPVTLPVVVELPRPRRPTASRSGRPQASRPRRAPDGRRSVTAGRSR